MALRFFWRCESTTLDGTDDYSASDTTATANGAVSLDAGASRVGTNGILVGGGGQHYRFDNTTIGNDLTTEGSMAFSYRVTANPAGLADFGVILRGAGSNDYFKTRIVNSYTGDAGTVRFVTRSSDTGGAEVSLNPSSGANALADATWYGVVVRWDQVNSLRRLEVYDSAGALIEAVENTSAFVAPISFTSSTGIRIGEDSGFAVTAHIDNVFIADAYDEPLEDYLDITSYTEYGGGGGGFQSAWACNSNQVIQ
jgi:hypothetical protein